MTTLDLHPEFVFDDARQRKVVILPEEEWNRLMEELEDMADVAAYDAAKREIKSFVPIEQIKKDLDDARANMT